MSTFFTLLTKLKSKINKTVFLPEYTKVRIEKSPQDFTFFEFLRPYSNNFFEKDLLEESIISPQRKNIPKKNKKTFSRLRHKKYRNVSSHKNQLIQRNKKRSSSKIIPFVIQDQNKKKVSTRSKRMKHKISSHKSNFIKQVKVNKKKAKGIDYILSPSVIPKNPV